MKKGTILENIFVEKLVLWGKGLAQLPDGKKIIITGWVIPESVVNLRVLKNKKKYLETQVQEVVKTSPYEQELPEKFQVYGWCKWLPIAYEKQLEIKQNQVVEAFHHLKQYTRKTNFHPIIPSPETYAYRNKVEFSWGVYISQKEGIHDEFRFGFHKQAEFSKIINCRYCVLADDQINDLFHKMDVFSRQSGLSIYDPVQHKGFWRHFVIRKTHFRSQVMLLISINNAYENYTEKKKQELINFCRNLAQEHANIVSCFFVHNSGKADIVQGEYEHIYWEKSIIEELLGYEFEIKPQSFFQTNSLGAEKLYTLVQESITEKWKIALDLYAGTGTIGTFLSSQFEKIYSVEYVASAVEDGKANMKRNKIDNIEFVHAKVEDFLQSYLQKGQKADVLVIDPPRSGMHPKAVENLLQFQAKTIVYVSCNPATLVRDVEGILTSKQYKLTDVTPVDMFPHTHHIETVACFQKI